MSRYLTVDDVAVSGANVLVRSDLNVPLEGGVVLDDFRIRAALPTLEGLTDAGARVFVLSHLGRPKGVDPDLSLRVVAERMNALSSVDVGFIDGGEITLLENTRFRPGETSNDPEFATELAAGMDLFVEDAFGSVHRAHASTVGVAQLVRSVAGPLLDRELTSLRRLLDEPESPYVVVLGGAKVSDKLAVIENLLPKVDQMLIGGGMCFTFLEALGNPVGDSIVEDSMLDQIEAILQGPHGAKIQLPSDIVVGREFAADTEHRVTSAVEMPAGWMGLDVGPETGRRFADLIREARSVFWNGPMGVYEWEPFSHGTRAVAEAIAMSAAYTVVGGGDSAAALRSMDLADAVSHLSTGGGAGLELLEGRVLPGVAVLERWVDE